jgi:glycosyltransferase involved in cell wall biosynthesis
MDKQNHQELAPAYQRQGAAGAESGTLPERVEVLLPVYNEAEHIESTIRGLYDELSKYAKVGFIVCEDGSRDGSREILRKLASDLPMRLNFSDARRGYSKAMRDGMAMAEAEYLLCLDSDGQCDPRDFPDLWVKRDRADVVIGWRVRRADSLVRRVFSRFFYILYQAVFRTPVHDPSCPFVLFRRAVAHDLSGKLGEMREGFWWEFVARAHRRGLTILETPVHHRVRAAGETQVYSWRKMPSIFFRHVLALGAIWKATRPAA